MSVVGSSEQIGGKVHATQSQLRSAFRQHLQCVKALKGTKEKNNFPCKLLLFYAVECGLKYLLLKMIRKSNSTANLDEEDLVHDLSTLWGTLKRESRFRASEDMRRIRGAPQFNLKDEHGPRNRNISQAHQAWRYGVQIDPDSEKAIIEWLEKVSTWIEKFENEERG